MGDGGSGGSSIIRSQSEALSPFVAFLGGAPVLGCGCGFAGVFFSVVAFLDGAPVFLCGCGCAGVLPPFVAFLGSASVFDCAEVFSPLIAFVFVLGVDDCGWLDAFFPFLCLPFLRLRI